MRNILGTPAFLTEGPIRCEQVSDQFCLHNIYRLFYDFLKMEYLTNIIHIFMQPALKFDILSKIGSAYDGNIVSDIQSAVIYRLLKYVITLTDSERNRRIYGTAIQ